MQSSGMSRFQLARIVDSTQRRIKIRVIPNSSQFRGIDCSYPSKCCKIDGISDRGQFTISAGDAVVGRGSITQLSTWLIVGTTPCFDSLQTVKVCPRRVAQRGDNEVLAPLLHRRRARGQTSLNCLWCIHQVQGRGGLHRLFQTSIRQRDACACAAPSRKTTLWCRQLPGTKEPHL